MKRRIIILIALSLAASSQSPTVTPKANAISTAQAGASQTARFTPVEGSDLRSRIDAAAKLARARAQSAFYWTAYSFDVRSGIAVDADVTTFRGSIINNGGTSIMIGTSNGMRVETRNLAVFALYGSDNKVARVEVYNLDRQREYGGYQVYWAGRASNQESLAYLKSLAESGDMKRVAENATAAIGMHDDQNASVTLKSLARPGLPTAVRATAVFWIGYIGGEQAYLADIIRNERENVEVRESAASALGRSRESAILSTLRGLYDAVNNRQVKESLLYSISKNDDQKGAVDFLSRVLKSEPDRQLKEAAVHQLGRIPGTQAMLVELARNEQESREVREAAVHAIGRSDTPSTFSTLEGLYRSVSDAQVRESIIHAVGRKQDEKTAINFLVQVAKNDADRNLRENAIHRLGKMEGTGPLLLEIARNESESTGVREAAVHAISRGQGAAALSTLQELYGAISNSEVKQNILHAIARNQDREASFEFLIKVAERDPHRELREQALHNISRSSSPRALQTLTRVASDSNADPDMQEQAVHAISRRTDDEAVPALIQIARSHPRAQVREAAVRRLSRTRDARAIEFLKELLSK
jgi:HEAT repeat protein